MPIEAILRCIKCDPATGKQSDACSSCEKCENGECVSNCPNRCEICEDGTCRKCGEGPCETCDERTGHCFGCDPKCERCNGATRECETTCERGLACCAGACRNCCGSCDGDTCAGYGDAQCAPDAKMPACCDGTCHELDDDARHCGSCNNACRDPDLRHTGERCEHGRCVCKGVVETIGEIATVRGGGMECREKDHECCDGQCINTSTYQTDPKHCGKCIVECEKDERCVKGRCVGGDRLSIQFAYIGFKFVESTPEDCPDMRPGGREVITAKLSLIRGGLYEGPGRLSADIDGCGLTPNREDPGMVQNRGDVLGDFHGDNFLGCKVSTVVPEHAVRVRVEVDMVDAHQPNYVKIEWEPTGPPDVRVSTGCEAAFQAAYVTQMTKEYRRENRRQITDYDLLKRMVPGGRLREGTYTDPDGTEEGRWIFTVGGNRDPEPR